MSHCHQGIFTHICSWSSFTCLTVLKSVNPGESKTQQDSSSWKSKGAKSLPDILNIQLLFTQLISQSWKGVVYARGKVTLTHLTSISAKIRPSFEPLAHLSALYVLEEMTLGSYTSGLCYHVNSVFKLPEQHSALQQGCDWNLVRPAHK